MAGQTTIVTNMPSRERRRLAQEPPPKTHRVVVLAPPGVVTFDLASAVQIFSAPDAPSRTPWPYEVVVVGQRRTVPTADRFQLLVERGLERFEQADTIIVPGKTPHATPPDDVVLEALRDASGRGVRVLSICVGAFVLGHAGLLDGRRATTHWAAAPEFRRMFPKVMVQADELYVDEGQVMTSSGLAAGLDLCLHVLRKDLGAERANRHARWNVCAPHRSGGQAQYVQSPLPARAGGTMEGTLSWALQHLDEPLSVRALADHAHMTLRTFNRHFAAVTGTTPKEWIVAQRLVLGRRLLETTDASVERVAVASGFGTAAGLRAQFRNRLHTTPSAYRATFGHHSTGV